MKFSYLHLTPTGKIEARAEGHANEVVTEFHRVCMLLLSSQGPWRMTSITGTISDEEPLESKMNWVLQAQLKGLSRPEMWNT